MSMKERILYIDMAKGFAMVTIVMLHVVASNLEGDVAITINFFNHSFNTRLFFFLSGMVVALRGADLHKRKDSFIFFRKKTYTLLIPFLVWSLIVLPYIYYSSDINLFFDTAIASFIPPFNCYWFLLYLYVIQIFYLFVKALSDHLKPFVSSNLLRETVLFGVISIVLFPIYEYYLFFILGYFFFRYGKDRLFKDATLAISFCLFIGFFSILREDGEDGLAFGYRFTMAISASIVVVNILKRIESDMSNHSKTCLLLSFIGRNSLEIYLLHYYIVWVCKGFFFSVSSLYGIPLYLIVFVISFVVCLLCCYIAIVLKKIPYVSFLLFGNH